MTENYNYGLSCVIQAGMDWAMAMEFEADPSYDANANTDLSEMINQYE